MFDFFQRDEVRAALRRCLILLVTLTALPTYLALGARYWWVLELATHFCVVYVCTLIPAVLLTYWLRSRKLLVWTSLALTINLWLVIPLYFGSNVANSDSSIRLLLANVLSSNLQHDRLLEVIQREQPDIIVLLEINQAWNQQLKKLEQDYPYSLIHPRTDNFGICLFSKLPAKKLQVAQIGPSGVPSIEAEIIVQQKSLQLLATHPLPPTSKLNSLSRNQHLLEAGKRIAELPSPKILTGDLNTTPWSPFFRDLLAICNLTNSQRGFGIQPTWFGLIPIDHVLHSSEISILDRQVGPAIGSDHRPVILDFSIN